MLRYAEVARAETVAVTVAVAVAVAASGSNGDGSDDVSAMLLCKSPSIDIWIQNTTHYLHSTYCTTYTALSSSIYLRNFLQNYWGILFDHNDLKWNSSEQIVSLILLQFPL